VFLAEKRLTGCPGEGFGSPVRLPLEVRTCESSKFTRKTAPINALRALVGRAGFYLGHWGGPSFFAATPKNSAGSSGAIPKSQRREPSGVSTCVLTPRL